MKRRKAQIVPMFEYELCVSSKTRSAVDKALPPSEALKFQQEQAALVAAGLQERIEKAKAECAKRRLKAEAAESRSREGSLANTPSPMLVETPPGTRGKCHEEPSAKQSVAAR